MGGMAAALTVLVQARGVGAVNTQLAGVQGNLNKTGAKAGGMGAAMKKGLMIGAAAVGALVTGLYKLGESFDDAYDTIRVGTGATGKQLDRLKGDFREVVKAVPASFGDASTAIADLNTRLGLTGKPLQDRAKQFLELSRITKTDVATNIKLVTRAFGDWEVKTKDQGAQLDKFFRAAQASGATVDELALKVVQFGAPLRQVGFSLDESTALFAAFEKAGVNVETMMPGLKMALKNFMKEGIDPKQGLQKTFKGIKDGSIDASEAMKIFGTRAGPDMVEAIQQGRFSMGDMLKTIQGGSDTIMKAGKDTQDFSEKWQIFKNRVMVGLEPLATAVFGAMGTAMDKLPGIAAKVIGAIAAIIGPFVALGKAVADNKAAMIALSPIVAMLAVHFLRLAVTAAISAVLNGVVVAFWALNAAMRANPIGMVITAISLLVAAIIVLYKESETFRAIVTGAWNAIKTATTAVWGFLKAFLTGWWSFVVALVKTSTSVISSIISGAWSVVKSVTTGVWNGLKSFLTALWNVLKSSATTTFNAIKSIVTTVWNTIKTVTTSVWNAIKSALRTTWNAIKSIATTTWNGIRSVILTPMRFARDTLVTIVQGTKTRLDTGWTNIKNAAREAWEFIKGLVLTPIRAARDAIPGILEGMLNRLGTGFRNIIKAAGEFGSNVKEKVTNAFKSVVNTVGKFINKIIGVINKIPGVDIKYRFTPLAEGGALSSAEVKQRLTGAGGLARGGVVNRPQVLVGEEAPRHPEYVIPTNPAYRDRASALMASAAQKMGLEGFARGGVLGNADTFASVARKVGAGPKSTLALFMAGVVESGMRNLSYGHLDSRGILQVRDSTARAMGINNMNVAQVAHAFLTRGFWGRGGAMAIARGNLGAGAVAQLTQGSAFPARYEQERGRALAFLKAARNRPGGLEGLLKGAAGVIGDIASALNPMDFINQLPGIGGLPDWLKGTGRYVLDKAKDYIRDKVASVITGSGAIPGGVSGTIQDAIRFSRAFGQWSFSPGQLKRSGGGGYHPLGRAVDFGDAGKSRKQMEMLYKGLKGKYGKHIKELFYDPMGEHVKNGQTIGRPFGGHGDHIHLALAQGGLLSRSGATMKLPQFGGSFANGGIVPGAIGQPRTVIAHGGEQIGPPNLDGVEIAVYIGGERIDDRVDTRIEIRDRQKDAAWRAGLAT